MTEGDVWFNTQKTTLHIERGGKRKGGFYYCGRFRAQKDKRWFGTPDYKIADTYGAHFCRRCVKIKMQWAWKK